MSDEETGIDWDSLTFSFTPTDMMYVATCKLGEDWQPGELQPFSEISISPAAGVLNYGQGIFEGMKAQRSAPDRAALPELMPAALFTVMPLRG